MGHDEGAQQTAATTPRAWEERRAGYFQLVKDAAVLVERFPYQLTVGTRVHEVNANTTVGELLALFGGEYELDLELPIQSKACGGGRRCSVAADSGGAA